MKLIKCDDNEITLNQLFESIYAGNTPILVWINTDDNVRLIIRNCQQNSEICWIDLLKCTGPFWTGETNLHKFLTRILDRNETIECFYSIYDFGKWLTNLKM